MNRLPTARVPSPQPASRPAVSAEPQFAERESRPFDGTIAEDAFARIALGPSSDAMAEAWERVCLERERLELMMATSVGCFLLPCWSFTDSLVSTALVPWAAWLRLAGSALLAGAFFLARRTHTLRRIRIGAHLSYGLVSVIVAVILSRVQTYYFPYVTGYSLILLAAAVGVSMPVRQVFGLACFILAAFGLSHLGPVGADRDSMILAFVYLLCVAFIALAMTGARRRLQMEAFIGAWDSHAASRELRGALDQLRQAQARLVASEKMGVLGRVLAGLSHELNNPVNVIQNSVPPALGYVDAMESALRASEAREGELADGGAALRELRRGLDLDFARADLREAIAAIGDAAARIAAIHANLRAFVRGAAAAGATGSVDEGLRHTVDLIRRTLPPGVAIDERYGAPASIVARFDALNQVWLNLLLNALDAVGQSGVVKVATDAGDDFVEVRISDDGPGVPEGVRSRLFEPFFTTKEIGKGTGLGLSTCWEIVTAHGGSIALDPQHAPGASFVVRLPLRGP